MFTYFTDALQIQNRTATLPTLWANNQDHTNCRLRTESYVHGQDPPLTAGGDRKGSAFSYLHS